MYSPCLYVHVYEISDNVYAKLQGTTSVHCKQALVNLNIIMSLFYIKILLLYILLEKNVFSP